MSNITAAMVKDLRDKTGAGMMDCKAALGETGGDSEAAVDWLRKKGLSKAAKKAGRVAAEGLISVLTSDGRGVVVEVNAETDFVARNERFQTVVRMIASNALSSASQTGPVDAETLNQSVGPDGKTVSDALAEAIATVGENMTLRRAASIVVSKGVVGSYIHNAYADGLGRIGVIVGLESSASADDLAGLARQIAMHIAAANPLVLHADGLDAETVAREKAILAEKHVGKPASVVDKILENGLKTYYKDVCLLDQAFIHDPSKSVSQMLKEAEGKLGSPISVAGYVRYSLGEGIEKQETDFAAEVAAVANG